MSIDRRNDPPESNWSLALALSVHDDQLIQAALDISQEIMRDEGREATLADVKRTLIGDPPRRFPRMD
jgi:hypothetical protein